MDVMIGLKSKWTNHAQCLVFYVFLQAVLMYRWHYKDFSTKVFHSFPQQTIQSRGWIFHCMGHFKNLCVCECVCCTFICIHCEWLSTISACKLLKQRWFWENGFIFIHISCKNNTNRSNDRDIISLIMVHLRSKHLISIPSVEMHVFNNR